MSLYHYKTTEDANKMFYSSTIRLSQGSWDILETFQDYRIREGNFNIYDYSELRDFTELQLSQILWHFYSILKDKLYYISFTKTEDCPAMIQNFCRGDGCKFVFDDSLIPYIKSQIITDSNFIFVEDRVRYVSNVSKLFNMCHIQKKIISVNKIKKLLKYNLNEILYDNKSINLFLPIIKSLVFKKDKTFNYENEYRIVIIDIGDKITNGEFSRFIKFDKHLHVDNIIRYKINPVEETNGYAPVDRRIIL